MFLIEKTESVPLSGRLTAALGVQNCIFCGMNLLETVSLENIYPFVIDERKFLSRSSCPRWSGSQEI